MYIVGTSVSLQYGTTAAEVASGKNYTELAQMISPGVSML